MSYTHNQTHTMDSSSASASPDDPRSITEVRNNNDTVRYYEADGHLYAYRDADIHVVVSRGREPQTRWVTQTPADRRAVVAGEHLWTIPDNWNCRVTIDGVGVRQYAIYQIPETGVDVLLTVPNKNHLVDAWFNITRVGTLDVTYDDAVAWDELERTLTQFRGDDTVDACVLDALETLNRRRRAFEREFARGVDMCAEENLFENAHKPVPVDEWTTEPWLGHYPTDRLLEDFLDIDGETRAGVTDALSLGGVVPTRPTVRVDVDDSGSRPDGYEIRALVEAGMSGAEAIDYLITEHHDLMTQTEWATRQDKTASAVNKNVSAAESRLSK